MDAINLCSQCSTNLCNYLNELGKNQNIKYLYMMAKWRIERDKDKIKQLEEELKLEKENFSTCEKLLDETRTDLYSEQEENQRLQEAINEIDDAPAKILANGTVCQPCVRKKEIARKALEK
jgi:septal ring factor EnvC (AmiA/AmiB activator)